MKRYNVYLVIGQWKHFTIPDNQQSTTSSTNMYLAASCQALFTLLVAVTAATMNARVY